MTRQVERMMKGEKIKPSSLTQMAVWCKTTSPAILPGKYASIVCHCGSYSYQEYHITVIIPVFRGDKLSTYHFLPTAHKHGTTENSAVIIQLSQFAFHQSL